MKFVYPEGKRKALTFSYDDSQVYDRRLAELLGSHGMRGTSVWVCTEDGIAEVEPGMTLILQ